MTQQIASMVMMVVLMGCASSSGGSSGDPCSEPVVNNDSPNNDPTQCLITKTCGSNAYKAECDPYNTPVCGCSLNGKLVTNVPYPDGVCANPAKAFAACHFP